MSRTGSKRVVPALVIAAVAAAVVMQFGQADATPMQASPPYCWHDRFVISSEWHCGDTTSAYSTVTISLASRFANEDSLLIIRDRDTITAVMRPGTDAIFLSRFAVDTFLVPYLRDNSMRTQANALAAHVRSAWRIPRPDSEPMFVFCGRLASGPQRWYCPDAERTIRVNPRTIRQVAFIRHIGANRIIHYPGRGVDAIFLSRDAAQYCLLRGDSRAATAHHQRADSLLARAAMLDPAWSLPVIRRGRLALSQPPQTSWVPEQSDSASYFSAPPPIRRRMWINRAATFADEALARDAKSAEALALRGAARYAQAISDPPRADSLTRLAEADLRAAIALRPNLVVAWHTLAQLAQLGGRFAEAAAAAQFAYDLDAFFEVAGVASTGFLSSLRAERYEDARRWCRIGLDHHAGDPRFAECRLTLLGWTGERRTDIGAAWQELQRIERADTLGMLGITAGYRRLMVAAVTARAGQSDSARAILRAVREARARDPRTMEYPIEESYVELLLGNRDRAITLLAAQAQASPAMRAVLASHPWFRPLRDDSRFAALLAPAR